MTDALPSMNAILFAAHPGQSVQFALAKAVALAQQLRAELHVLRVLPVGHRKTSDPQTEAALRAAKEELAAILPAEQVMELSVRWEVRMGDAAEQIVQYSRESDIDLVMLGSRRRSGLSRLFSGSVPEKVHHDTSCPVLMIPQDDAVDTDQREDSSLAGEPWDPESLADAGPAAPAFDLVRRAISLRATDVHIDPAGREGYLVRFRIDGRLEHYCTLDGDIGEHLIQRFKTLAGLDIADPFAPQEGYLRLPDQSAGVQVRVTTAPVEGGETICLRVHEESRMFRSLDALGLSAHSAEAVQEMLRRREGLIVVAGPTGSGKTTTIYSMLQELRAADQQLVIASIEDPVELNVPFLRQMNVDEAHGTTLNRGLRTLLRLDPDVLFVGEIRDSQTAQDAMRAASSGRHVFTTLHSREAAATITIFDDLGVNRRSLSANLTGIISQRLVRRLCTQCRIRRPIRDDERRSFERYEREPPGQLWQAPGCDHCRHLGYRGRTGIFETVVMTDALRKTVASGAGEDELRGAIRSEGAPSLMSDALKKAEDGTSTLQEVLQMRSMGTY
jgi:type II secretory ATPase GspE/PulE/Tfp pilus assembly ATPase PilB-like protein